MELLTIKDLFYHKFKAFKYHNMKFWKDNNGEYYCQACQVETQILYGHIFKLDLIEISYTLFQ